MIDESVEALTRLIEYARREADEQGLYYTGYFLEMAKNSVLKDLPHLQSRGLSGTTPSDADKHGTGLQ
jgi:hypothetical protein